MSLNELLPLCWLSYGSAAPLSHAAAQTWFCANSMISFAHLASRDILKEIHLVVYVHTILDLDCTKFRALKGLMQGQRSRGFSVHSAIHNYPCTTPYPGWNGFFSFSKAGFLKRLKWFCFTLLLHAATMVETSRMPRFSFWNECYRFAPNSKFHSATKDRKMDERVELPRRKYSRRRVCSQNVASLVAKV